MPHIDVVKGPDGKWHMNQASHSFHMSWDEIGRAEHRRIGGFDEHGQLRPDPAANELCPICFESILSRLKS